MNIMSRLMPAGHEKEEYPEVVYLRSILDHMDSENSLSEPGSARTAQGVGALITVALAMAGFDETEMPAIADKMLAAMEGYDAESFD